ncbi:phage portal protein [Sinorhizobium medicae]|uniref:phage portal protein n=1 Tax=Sinorhizobium medicae TaxID=110321 RepID=UPI000C7E7051|nr:phage portal protein [Sinorhizobium medicae]PLU29278.1 phage portal protein [Sinorhizobium medicae]PLU44462.1 phage portal protein [Sinorhizobium medicae]PLU56270.1 phage portal protein [Sinorhizobium medicae]PLU72400.1 phage portal protein [Sinorhizobium medicae]
MWPFNKTEIRATAPVEERIASSDPYLGQFLGARWQGSADIAQASGLAVAHRCISLVSESLASVPLKLYKDNAAGGAEPATEHPLYGVLMDETAPGVSAFDGREWLARSILTNGDSFHKIVRNGRGQVTALMPILPSDVDVERLKSGRLRYRWNNPIGSSETLLDHEVLHVRYQSLDGIRGRSPIQIAAQTFGLAVSQQSQAGAQAENSFRPAGALVFSEKLPAQNKESVMERFRQRFVGAAKAGDVMVLDGGATFQQFQFSSKDAEFLESRKLSALDICRVYGVPPTAAGILDLGTYANTEQEGRSLVTRCLAPWAKRVEAAMNISLLSPDARKAGFYVRHDLSELLRGDLKSQYEAYRVGRDGGWLSANDIRSLLDMSKIDGGDTYLEPLNMSRAGEDRSNA